MSWTAVAREVLFAQPSFARRGGMGERKTHPKAAELEK